jgi:hypothetical protein
MKLKTVTANDLAVATTKVLKAARKQPVIVRTPGEAALILRPLVDDDAADDLLVGSRAFRASVRAARRRRAAGKGIPLAEARRRLKP